ncbi:MAG: site-specific integrase [Lewinella sp.]|nr:site-specific integrase [Lewinella sp.]
MKVKAILWKYAPRQDGTCDIKLYAYHQNSQKYLSTGLSVQPEEWDARHGAVSKRHPLQHAYNTNIRRMKLELEEHLLYGGTIANFREEETAGSLLDYFKSVIEKGDNGLLPIRKSTLKNYRSTHHRLTEYRDFKRLDDITFTDIDMTFYNGFSHFLATQRNCRGPGIGKNIKILKRVMNMALEEKLHTNLSHRDPAFKVHRQSASTKIYLTVDELSRLEQLDLSGQPILERERDRFLLAYWLLMRFSDVCRVNRSWVFRLNGRTFLRYQSQKTGTEATLPLKETALAMLEKYDYDFSFTGNVQANRDLKTVAAMAQMNQHVNQGDQGGPKSAFVTTHTARRSAATNLYLEGASLKMIGDLGGWRDLQTLRTYLRASGLDTAQVAVDLAFFS